MRASIVALGLVICASVLPSRASADTIAVGDAIRFLGTDGTIGGGAFHVDNLATGAGEDFLSFCLQRTQYVDYSHTFYVGGITDYADDYAGNDEISDETRWIFKQFRKGTLSAYSSNEIQAAIWKLEDEWTGAFGNSDLLIAQAQAAVLGGARVGGVKVINLFYENGTRAQDQLVLKNVPEPATLVLFGMALIGAARLPRRRNAA